MADRRVELGQRGEAAARDFLEQQGYTILATNYRFHLGEIDIVASQGETLVFVEVRVRTSGDFGTSDASVTPAIRKSLIAPPLHYPQAHQHAG